VVASFYRDHVSNAFDYADGYIRSVRQVYLQRQSLADVRRYLTEIPISAEFVSHITLMGPDGRPRLLMSAQGERTPNRTRHARDRAYFKFQHNTPGDKIY
ncbi:MAG: hypothetical protein GWN87_13990, partial [Desulfuromonadales bacterium]|nr:hypothetical protein [Desulfuromonadales bacterium]